MAAGIKLVATFKCDDGKEHNFSYNYAKAEPSDAQISALLQAMITNGAIFENVPLEATAIKTVVTTENHFVID